MISREARLRGLKAGFTASSEVNAPGFWPRAHRGLGPWCRVPHRPSARGCRCQPATRGRAGPGSRRAGGGLSTLRSRASGTKMRCPSIRRHEARDRVPNRRRKDVGLSSPQARAGVASSRLRKKGFDTSLMPQYLAQAALRHQHIAGTEGPKTLFPQPASAALGVRPELTGVSREVATRGGAGARAREHARGQCLPG